MAEEGALGVIGGNGLYSMAGLEIEEEVALSTPFGQPSDSYVVGRLEGRRLVFLPRHGCTHSLLPGELNFRANIWGFKKLGIERIVSVSAVGSMKEAIEPLHVVLPDQFLDRTRGRISTFFGRGLVAHVGFAHPLCPTLSRVMLESSHASDATMHMGGTYVCMEGPQFSTLAESKLYRTWGMDVIGMTNLQEAKLAREAEICYATLALVTDYDCWHEGHDEVTVDMIIANLQQNAKNAQRIIAETVGRLPIERTCECAAALATAIITRPDQIPAEVKKDLAPIIRRYVT